jgi:hypothetical protein
MQFFKIRYKNYSPWIWKFVRKDDYCLLEERRCSACGETLPRTQKNENYYDRPFDALLHKMGSKWTDCIGSGEGVFTLVSQRVLEIWEAEGIGKFPAFPVKIIPPYPKKVMQPPPIYYRLDNKRIIGAEMDLEASGFINVRYCDRYHNYFCDYIQSQRMSDFKITLQILKDRTWNGKHIFSIKYPNYLWCLSNTINN